MLQIYSNAEIVHLPLQLVASKHFWAAANQASFSQLRLEMVEQMIETIHQDATYHLAV